MELREPIIEARGVEKSYQQPDGHCIQVIAPTDFAIYPDQIVALLGASGCGKSTMLRILTGLTSPSAGEVLWHGRRLDGQIPNVSIVFQSFALFPWLTVLDNVEAPLKARGIRAIERHKRALKILDTVGLDGFEAAYPKELSGGMKQRVGFARAMVVEPELLFMDEPFSALDVLMAEHLRKELLELWLSKKISTRAIFLVTHNIEEAMLLADRIIVLDRNPAQIRADFDVNLPHPRNHQTPRFNELMDYIYKLLTQPKLEHALPLPETKTVAEGEQPPPHKYPMLPHARPDGIAGFLEILLDRGGREDLHHLADELVMEVDDLLPIIEAAALLHFARLHEGEVQVTPEGRTFAEADILTRKILFRQAALQYALLLRQVERALRARSDHTLPDAFFHDILDEHFTEEDARKQLETAILWGRYAEIFDYDVNRKRLFLTENVERDQT